MKIIGLLGAVALGAAWSAPAAASAIVSGACVSVSDPAGCRFTGNINNNPNASNQNSYLFAQNLYNAGHDDIILSLITGTDLAGFGSFGSITGAGTASGTWSLPGFDVQYIAVKASPGFVLYEVSGSTGSWDTFDIPYNNNPHNLSHLMFFGSLAAAVPEPSAWALMILGVGMTGAAMRQQRKVRVRFA